MLIAYSLNCFSLQWSVVMFTNSKCTFCFYSKLPTFTGKGPLEMVHVLQLCFFHMQFPPFI